VHWVATYVCAVVVAAAAAVCCGCCPCSVIIVVVLLLFAGNSMSSDIKFEFFEKWADQRRAEHLHKSLMNIRHKTSSANQNSRISYPAHLLAEKDFFEKKSGHYKR